MQVCNPSQFLQRLEAGGLGSRMAWEYSETLCQSFREGYSVVAECSAAMSEAWIQFPAPEKVGRKGQTDGWLVLC